MQSPGKSTEQSQLPRHLSVSSRGSSNTIATASTLASNTTPIVTSITGQSKTSAADVRSSNSPLHQQQQQSLVSGRASVSSTTPSITSAGTIGAASASHAVMSATSGSDPHAIYLNSACMEFLLIELIPLAERVVDEISQKAGDKQDHDRRRSSSVSKPGIDVGVKPSAGNKSMVFTNEERRDAVFKHVDNLGYRVGQGLVERYFFWLLHVFS